MAKVNVCKCEHEFQDEVYGKGKRLFNEAKDGAELRCTVCGTQKKIREDVKK